MFFIDIKTEDRVHNDCFKTPCWNRKRILTRKLVHCRSEMRSFQSNCPLSPPNELTLMENVLSIWRILQRETIASLWLFLIIRTITFLKMFSFSFLYEGMRDSKKIKKQKCRHQMQIAEMQNTKFLHSLRTTTTVFNNKNHHSVNNKKTGFTEFCYFTKTDGVHI